MLPRARRRIASANRSPACAHASRTRSGSTGTGPVVAVRSGSNPAARPTRSRISSGSSVGRPVIPNCFSGSPSWSRRMCRSTLSSGWLISGPATAPERRPSVSSSRPTARGVQRSSRAGRRAACDPITSIDPIVRGARRRPERRPDVELRGSVVVITGASSGFGELTALRFRPAGARVVLGAPPPPGSARGGPRVVPPARRLERLEALAERIASEGGSALAVRCDVTELDQLTDLRDRVGTTFARCDVLINNAGIRGGGPFETSDIEYLNRVVDVNLRGVVLGTKLFLPMMLGLGRGHIVNVASLAGRFATPGAAIYGATKHAVVALSEALYHELGPKGILVTSVNPGFSPTEGFPATGPSIVRLDPDDVAKLIVDVVRKGRVREVSIPRALAALQAF